LAARCRGGNPWETVLVSMVKMGKPWETTGNMGKTHEKDRKKWGTP